MSLNSIAIAIINVIKVMNHPKKYFCEVQLFVGRNLFFASMTTDMVSDSDDGT